MYYFDKKNDNITKYKVEVDKRQLLNLRREVVYASSEVINANSKEERFIYPHLIDIIDELIVGKTTSLSDLYYPDLIKEKHYDLRYKRYMKKKVNKCFYEYEHLNYFDIQTRREKLIELEKIVLEYEKMAMIKPVAPYYEKLKALIGLKYISTLPKHTYNKQK